MWAALRQSRYSIASSDFLSFCSLSLREAEWPRLHQKGEGGGGAPTIWGPRAAAPLAPLQGRPCIDQNLTVLDINFVRIGYPYFSELL